MSEKKEKHHGGLSGQHDDKFKGEYAVTAVFHRSLCCRLGLTKDDTPYVVPMTFTYEGYDIYLHSHPTGKNSGKKNEYIEYMRQHNYDVCLEFDVVGPISPGTEKQPGCAWSLSFASVIGYGKIEKVTNLETKMDALERHLLRYTGRKWKDSPGEEDIKNTIVWKVSLDPKRTTNHYHLIKPPTLK
jgi:nitroimidazol reductase NimA-like FMN-containing flavoprotein (pyridoxamine 5'-phosphate oxidase superfamily)